MNELLQRLRDREAHTHNMQYQETYPTIKLCEEAADEIETLRRIADLVYNDFRKEAWEEAHAYFTSALLPPVKTRGKIYIHCQRHQPTGLTITTTTMSEPVIAVCPVCEREAERTASGPR